MTISSTVRKAGPFDGTGSQTEFPFEFKVFSAGDLYVVQYNEVISVETVLELDSDYTVTLNADQDNDPGGTIELTSALAVNYTLTITSSLANLQPTDLTNRGGFYPSVINDALDRACIQIQQLQDETDRTLKTAVSVPDGVDNTLPMPAANMVIGWDNTGVALKNWSVNDLVTSVAYGSAKADIFTGDGETVDFYLDDDPANINNLDVSVGGVCQVPVDDYTWMSGKKVTFTTAPPSGEKILIRYMQALPQGTVVWSGVSGRPFVDYVVYITSDTTITTAVNVLEGGMFVIASGKTLTINGSFSCGLFQCFGGAGSVVFGSGSVAEVYPEWWGAKGDGEHDDTTAIQAAIQSLHTYGGTLAFTNGGVFYNVSAADVPNEYGSIFPVRSNMTIIGKNNATIKQTVEASLTWYFMFNADPTALPVKNLVFKDLIIETNTIGLNVPQNSPANQIENVEISGCTFNSCGGPYIVHRSDTATDTRQVKNVRILNNYGNLAEGQSFITADGDGILIQGNTALAPAVGGGYDAVSIHSGVDVRIIGNKWNNFLQGQTLNIRNSPENHCGTRNVISMGNMYNNCTFGVQISTQSGESAKGVHNIIIANEDINQCGCGVNIDPGLSSTGTPFNNIVVANNQCTDVEIGISAAGAGGGVYPSDVSITGNVIKLNATTGDYGIRLKNIYCFTVTGNTVFAPSNSSSCRLFEINGYTAGTTTNGSICGNSFFADNAGTSSNPLVYVAGAWDNVISNNYVSGVMVIDDPTKITANGNNIVQGYIKGWYANKWQIDYGTTTIYGSATPGAGTPSVGDRIINTSPASGSPVAWTYTSDGWKSEGNL